MISEEQFLNLINKFLKRQIKAKTFCFRFTKFWILNVDAMHAKKLTWPKRYDVELIDALQCGEITKEEFTKRWDTLFGNEDTKLLQEMLDAMHSACYCYRPNPDPESSLEIDENQLREEIEKMLKSYKSGEKPAT